MTPFSRTPLSSGDRTSTRPALAVTGLIASYGPTPRGEAGAVLRQISLNVQPGEDLAILGPSGCGKTTLLRVLAGLHPADAGLIDLDGRRVTDGTRALPPELRGVGLVPQEAALFPHHNVAANIEFGLRSRRSLRRHLNRTARRRRVREMLDLVGLSGFEQRFPDELSGGERQRIALARALAPEPAIVLLDEAFGALDASLRSHLRADVRDILRRTSATAILVTHDQDEALSMADRIALMRDGDIVQVGAPSEVYSRPSDAWTAHFLGECSILRGTSDGARINCALGTIPQEIPVGMAQVFIRPEQIFLSTTPLDGSALPATPATVTAAEYRGHSTIYRLHLSSTGESLIARAHDDTGHPVGSTVHVSIRGRVHSVTDTR